MNPILNPKEFGCTSPGLWNTLFCHVMVHPSFSCWMRCLGTEYDSFAFHSEGCTVDFENQNYTILTSQCKGPQYQTKLCCAAFKQFACPFVDEANDLTTDCASTMFSYINLYGKYPPGLFANECKEGKESLDCRAVPPAGASGTSSAHSSNAQKLMAQATWLVAGTFVLLLVQLLLP
ncbi:hypothetical protein SAY86_028421 [Trapa natans]|uniref:GPI-anchored protein LLG1-like domain-containing protein n=1 Tax=Trapa natans TaxID=22666 RepID=A0AAN7LZQ0_TRANT|nr:hypothetical protein SAY86_028421 [Trapa natans]